MADILPGTNVTIAGDIIVNDTVAFSAGELVVVEQVSPNQQRPEYKYIVMSARLGTRFQLRDADLIAPPAPQQAIPSRPPVSIGHRPPARPLPQQRRPVGRAPIHRPRRSMSRRALVVIIAVIVVVVAGGGAAAYFLLAKKSTTTNETTVLPPGFAEAGLPVYPGAHIDEVRTYYESSPGGQNKVKQTEMWTEDSIDKVAAWYKSKLSGRPGFEVFPAVYGDPKAKMMWWEEGVNHKLITVSTDEDNYPGKTVIFLNTQPPAPGQ